MELWGTDESSAFWKRMLLAAIGVIAADGVLLILYFAYETYYPGASVPAPASDAPQVPTEQRRVIESLTAPEQASDSSAAPSGPSGAPASAGESSKPKPPAELTAPAPEPSSGTSAQAKENQAVIDSLTAPH